MIRWNSLALSNMTKVQRIPIWIFSKCVHHWNYLMNNCFASNAHLAENSSNIPQFHFFCNDSRNRFLIISFIQTIFFVISFERTVPTEFSNCDIYSPLEKLVMASKRHWEQKIQSFYSNFVDNSVSKRKRIFKSWFDPKCLPIEFQFSSWINCALKTPKDDKAIELAKVCFG